MSEKVVTENHKIMDDIRKRLEGPLSQEDFEELIKMHNKISLITKNIAEKYNQLKIIAD